MRKTGNLVSYSSLNLLDANCFRSCTSNRLGQYVVAISWGSGAGKKEMKCTLNSFLTKEQTSILNSPFRLSPIHDEMLTDLEGKVIKLADLFKVDEENLKQIEQSITKSNNKKENSL